MDLMTKMAISDPFGVSGSVTISSIAVNIVKIVYAIIGIVFFGLILYAGFTWLTSAGNPDKIKEAVSIVTSAIVGLFIALAAGAITGLLGSVLGVSF